MISQVEPFALRLNKALQVRRMKPADLSRKTGISESTISQYRSGYATPKSKKLQILADALRVSPSWLMGLQVPMDEPLDYVVHLTNGETLMIESYRRADDRTRQAVMILLGLGDEAQSTK